MITVQALSLIALECPECGLTTEEFLGYLTHRREQACPACGAVYPINLNEIPATVGLTRSLLPGAVVLFRALQGLILEARSR